MPADWPKWTDGYAVQSNGDWGGCYHERGEIFDTVRDHGITGFAILAGDLYSFWAGYASKSLPPAGKFEPVGVSFVGGSITSPGAQEAQEHGNKKNPLRKLFIADHPDGTMEPTMNLLLHHGVRFALEYAESGELAKALGGHGYGVVSVDASRMVTDFVCIPRPIERAATPEGGPLRYRLRHKFSQWRAREAPIDC